MNDQLFNIFRKTINNITVRKIIFSFVHHINKNESPVGQSVKLNKLSTYALVYYGYLDALDSTFHRNQLDSDFTGQYSTIAVQRGHYNIVISGLFSNFSGMELGFAAKHQYLEIFYYLIENLERYPMSFEFGLMGAVESGNLDIVKLVIGQFREILGEDYYLMKDVDIQRSICHASKAGHLEIIKYLFEHLSPFSHGKSNYYNALDQAAGNGYLDIVMFLNEERSLASQDAMNTAATNGHLGVVVFLHENRSEGCNFEALRGSTSNGHTDIVKYLLANRKEAQDDCPTALEISVIKGHAEIVDYLLDKNNNLGIVSVSESLIADVASRGHLEVLKIMKKHLISLPISDLCLNFALENNRLDVAKWLYQQLKDSNNDFKINKYTLLAAVTSESVETVKWANETVDHPIDPSTCEILNTAVEHGCLEVIKYLIENSTHQCEAYTLEKAATTGRLNILDYLKERYFEYYSLEISPEAMDLVAKHGHLQVVRWLTLNRTESFTDKAMDLAAANNHLEIVKFLHENRSEGCTTDAIDFSFSNNHYQVVEFLLLNRTEGFTNVAIENFELDPSYNKNIDLKSLRKSERKSNYNIEKNDCIIIMSKRSLSFKVVDDLGDCAPCVLNFRSGAPPVHYLNDKSTHFKSLTNENKKQRVLISNTDSIEYETEFSTSNNKQQKNQKYVKNDISISNKTNHKTTIVRLVIGKYNEKTGKIDLIPIPDVCQVNQSIIGYVKREEENTDELSFLDKSKLLSTSFGSKLSKKIIHKIESEDLGTLDSEKTKQMADTAKNKNLTDVVEEKNQDLPVFNLEAVDAKEIYPIEEIMPQEVYFAINPETFIGYAKNDNAPEDLPNYIKKRLTNLLYTKKRNDQDELVNNDKDQDDIEHESKILTYLYYLQLLAVNKRSLTLEDGLKQYKVPHDVIKHMLYLFSQQQSKFKHKIGDVEYARLMNYVVIISLHLENFSVKSEMVKLIAEAFKIPDYKLEKHYSRVGCNVIRDKQYRDFKLKAPLKLPEVHTKAPKGKKK
ncbi:putative RNA polymerase I subunit [Heterostelium album PN500]|uniref:Putative RNA polymerase I subunit n=1 Tax=Heterostelium pallidum (strain ATCC 26659 / Pp 5 / PN500) TaxID=670386 RepID=D3BD88_HETP5|nr:putative RNA polymerase I subunit [Heterostelium album PN500]EFA80880.1 putative RNA polymerase I subunit [Heterostelium album PN500]|eukprot:XP_020432999.1 putative RNA polymerase I subunit [Heterostelium album PN500]